MNNSDLFHPERIIDWLTSQSAGFSNFGESWHGPVEKSWSWQIPGPDGSLKLTVMRDQHGGLSAHDCKTGEPVHFRDLEGLADLVLRTRTGRLLAA